MRIHELEIRIEHLRKRISELSAISEKSATDLAEWRELKVQLAIAEDTIEQLKSRAAYLRKQSNLGKRFSMRTFDNFDASDNRRAYEACKRYVDLKVYDQEKNSLIICGSYGTGKTHLAAAIANQVVNKGVSVLFDTYGGHLERIKNEFGTTGVTYLNLMRSVDMLILDDVGKEKQTEWSASVMFDVINHRYESMKPIIITSNFNSGQLEEYFGEACYSRLIEMCNAVVTQGSDKRR